MEAILYGKEGSYMVDSIKKIKHVAMYLRISQEKKTENFHTLNNHRKLLTEYAQKNNYTTETFEEVLSGGTSELEQRPQLQKLLNEIEKFDAILVVELSRLSRNGLISETVLQYCKDYDKPIITPEKTFDLANSDTDVLTFRFGSLIASQEFALIGKRSKYNKIQMAKEGLHVSGAVPFGYFRNPVTKKLEIDEKTAGTVRYIFELSAKGYGSYKIRNIINTEGYRSATGRYFNIPTIKRIIQNPVYKGWTVFTDRKKVKRNGKFTFDIVDKIICKKAHPAIIQASLWDEVNKGREGRCGKKLNLREKQAPKTGVTILKDLLYCAVCGRKMAIKRDQKSQMYFLKKCEYLTDSGQKCNNSGIKLAYVEKNVLCFLKRYKERLEEFMLTLNDHSHALTTTKQTEQLNQLNKQIKEISAQSNKLIDLALTDIFTNEELKQKKQNLIDTLNILVKQRDQLLGEINNHTIAINKHVEGPIFTIDLLGLEDTSEELNEALKTVIKRIHYTRLLPDELLDTSTMNHDRKYFPFRLDIEYH